MLKIRTKNLQKLSDIFLSFWVRGVKLAAFVKIKRRKKQNINVNNVVSNTLKIFQFACTILENSMMKCQDTCPREWKQKFMRTNWKKSGAIEMTHQLMTLRFRMVSKGLPVSVLGISMLWPNGKKSSIMLTILLGNLLEISILIFLKFSYLQVQTS